MKHITLLALIAALAAPVASAFAEDAPQKKAASCEPLDVSTLQVAGKGFVMMPVRRPAVELPQGMSYLKDAIIQVRLPHEAARSDDGKVAKMKLVLGVSVCHDAKGETLRYQTRQFVSPDRKWHATGIPVPSGVRELEVVSCSAQAQKCWKGTWKGNSKAGVTLN